MSGHRFVAWVRYVVTPAPTLWRSRWQDRLFEGSVSIGGNRIRLVIFGANAMHWAINLWIFGRWVCFHPPTRTFGGRWPWYFYISRDATPTEATFRLGRRGISGS